jgi:hypothetical protein
MLDDFGESLQDQFDFYLPSTNYTWWNKIMCGAYISGPDDGPRPPKNMDWEGSPRMLQYAMLTARDYAITANVMFSATGLPEEVWNSAFRQLNNYEVLKMIRRLFARDGSGELAGTLASEDGYGLGCMQSQLTGSQPPKDMYGFMLWEQINAPRVGFQSVWSLETFGQLHTPTPCVLADIWCQIGFQRPVRAYSAFLPPNARQVGLDHPDSVAIGFAGTTWCVPCPRELQAHTVSLDDIPSLPDHVIFNNRLVWHTFRSQLYTMDGNVYNNSTVGPTQLVCQRVVTPDIWTPNLVGFNILRANTAWQPCMLPDSRRVVVGVTAADNSAGMLQVMSGLTQTATQVWLIQDKAVRPVYINPGPATGKSRFQSRPKASNSSSGSGPAPVATEEQMP